MSVVVVTGGIGSGKSSVCRMMYERGWTAQYDADARVKALYVEDNGLLASIEEALDCVLRDGNGVFQPRLLAQRIFSDKDALARVESLVFPELIEDFEKFKRRNAGEEVIVFESATILEKPQFDDLPDIVVLVDASLELRASRATSRDGTDIEAVRSRMASQPLMNRLSQGETDPRVDFAICNDGTPAELADKVEELMSNIHKQFIKK